MKSQWLYALLVAYSATPAWVQQGSVAQHFGGNRVSTEEQVLRLDDVLREAVDKSPEAQKTLHVVQAMRHRIAQATALPDPTVSVGWAGNPAPFSIMTKDASSYRGVTIYEQFPYPGKRKLQGAIAGKDVEAAQADYEVICRRIAAEARAAYYEYFYDDKALQTAKRNKETLEDLARVAEAQYRAGKTTQPDVLRAQVEVSLLLEKIIVLEQQRSGAQAQLNALMVRSPESPLPPAEEIQPAPMPASLDQLYALAAANDAVAQGDVKQIERGRLAVELAQKQLRPDIGVSYMFQQRAEQPVMNGLTFSVNIPLFSKSKQHQAISEASESLISAEKTRDERLNQVRLEMRQQYLAASAAEKLMNLYTKGVVPQASLALESSMASYQAGRIGIQPVLENNATLLDYETEYYRQLADYQTALARMESLTGADVSSGSSTTGALVQPALKEM
jgi:outer membrane protein, heavy metal efflux system